jgi:putative cell wall-binding protein/surface antigen
MLRARLGMTLLIIAALLMVPSAAMAVDDYPYKGQTDVDPWGFYKGYCTSFVAWRMNQNAGEGSFTNFMDGGRWGDAGNWADNARNLGIRVDRTPAVGAIAWWAQGTVSASGHVAYVEAVNTNGTIVVEDYNYSVDRGYTRRTITASSVSGFIHFHDVPVDTASPVITLACVADGATYAGPITPAFTASDASLASVSATLDGGPFASCSTISAEGEHALTVIATDGAGNTATTSVTFTIDFDAADPSVAFTTIAGSNRYETAAKVSAAAFDSAESVVLVTGENWPDALGGAALAGATDAPILLTRTASLPGETLAEIRRLQARSVVILGGTGAVSTAVEQALVAELGPGTVTRIGGADRYETSARVARAARAALGDGYGGECFVATGASFPDALAASPLSAAEGWPLVLTPPDGLTGSARGAMEAMGVSRAVVLGGTGVVGTPVEDALRTWLGDGAVERIAGADRYETAAKIADRAVAEGLQWEGAAIAVGTDFPDALAGGVLQGRSRSVLLLTQGTKLADAVRARLASDCAEVRSLRYLGGNSAVSCAVKATVDGVVR